MTPSRPLSGGGQALVAAAVLAALTILSACGARTTALPAPGAPHYPELAYPEPPVGMPQIAVERHRIGWQWLQSGDLRAAERSFSANLKDYPEFYPAEAGLGLVAVARKDYKGAVSHFDRVIAADAVNTPALVARGDAWLALGQRDQALASFVAAVAIDPKLTDVQSRVEVLRVRGLQEHVSVARKAAEEGKHAEAEAAYQQAIQASPQSPFLYRELAEIERKDRKLADALEHAQKASTLEPGDARHLVLIGEILEAQGNDLKAAEAYASAAALEPSPELDARMDALRERAAFAAMPEEYRTIETSPTVTRAQLAALVGVRLDPLLKRTPRGNAPVMTDTRSSWAAPWILSVARSGVMEPYPNHTFLPAGLVRRGDLAATVSQVISLLAPEIPSRVAAWRTARRRFPDLPPGHLSYPAASLAVESGVMSTVEGGEFQLSRPVTGAEAVAAVKKLEDLSGRRPR
jgi:tetratricopeptide (TPR) repeat protein